jgi:hypothetical protein
MDSTKNTYRNESLGFSITKPNNWFFLPTQWALTIRNRAEPSNEELQEILKNAQTPFVYMHFDHGKNNQVYPTAQASCRPINRTNQLERENILELQMEQLGKIYHDLDIIESSADGLICQCPTNIIKATLTIRNEEGNSFRCFSRSYAIFAGYLGFSLGLSGPIEGPYAFHNEFEEILKSVIID